VLKQNLGGHELEDDSEVETIVTRWLIIQGRNWMWAVGLITAPRCIRDRDSDHRYVVYLKRLK